MAQRQDGDPPLGRLGNSPQSRHGRYIDPVIKQTVMGQPHYEWLGGRFVCWLLTSVDEFPDTRNWRPVATDSVTKSPRCSWRVAVQQIVTQSWPPTRISKLPDASRSLRAPEWSRGRPANPPVWPKNKGLLRACWLQAIVGGVTGLGGVVKSVKNYDEIPWNKNHAEIRCQKRHGILMEINRRWESSDVYNYNITI